MPQKPILLPLLNRKVKNKGGGRPHPPPDSHQMSAKKGPAQKAGNRHFYPWPLSGQDPAGWSFKPGKVRAEKVKSHLPVPQLFHNS